MCCPAGKWFSFIPFILSNKNASHMMPSTGNQIPPFKRFGDNYPVIKPKTYYVVWHGKYMMDSRDTNLAESTAFCWVLTIQRKERVGTWNSHRCLAWLGEQTVVFFPPWKNFVFFHGERVHFKKRNQLGEPKMGEWREENFIFGCVQFEVLWDMLVETSSKNPT